MVWVYVWLGLFAVSLILEFVTMELVSIWIAVGSLITMILAFCGVPLIVQIIVFGVITVACILGLRKFALKVLFGNKGKTNLDVIIGTTHKLLKQINDDELGMIKINGVEWSVKSKNNEKIEMGSYVEIIEIDGNKFIVKSANRAINEDKKETK